jgi:hypothetical protein
MQKSQKYALIGFVSGFVLTFSGCKLWIGRTLHGESEIFGLFTGLLFGALFAIIGSILGNSEEKKQNKEHNKTSSKFEQLIELNKLKESGIITEDEFLNQKNEILNTKS